jgi:pyridoxal phosphate enzyme (YggS family)
VAPQALQSLLLELANVASRSGRPTPRLLAVSKRQPATAIAELAEAWQATAAHLPEQPRAFGENYVQEAQAKRSALCELPLEWHLIGHLQSNKADVAATLFDWVQTVDRASLVQALSRHRQPSQAPLNVLVQVNIDDETSKHGCRPDAVMPLAAAIAQSNRLRLRGLMAIPAPLPDLELRRAAFRRMKTLFDQVQRVHPRIDTLSMGMSEDFAIAIEEGSTMVRIGTALFGPRPAKDT